MLQYLLFLPKHLKWFSLFCMKLLVQQHETTVYEFKMKPLMLYNQTAGQNQPTTADSKIQQE